MHEHHEHATMTFGVLKKNILRQCITPQSIIMPTKRKGASKHRQSRRSRHSRRHRHSRRSVRGGMFGRNKPTMLPTLEPSHSGIRNMPFKLIGRKTPSDLLMFTGNIQMKDGNAHYMPNGFVLWRGDEIAYKPSGWYQVKQFDRITNMPIGRAYRVDSPENPVRIKDASGGDVFEVFNPPPPVKYYELPFLPDSDNI